MLMRVASAWLSRFTSLLVLLWALIGLSQLSAAHSAARQAPRTEAELVAQLIRAETEQRLDLLVELTALFRSHLGVMRPTTIQALNNLLQSDESPLVRSFAAHALGLAGDPAASDTLFAAFNSERELATRKAILYALLRYPSAQVTALLLTTLQHKEAELRATAAFVLAEQADTAAAPSLLTFLQKRSKEADAFARSQAVRGLGRIGYQAALPVLLTALQKDSAPSVQREAAVALGWLTTTRNNQVLTALQEAAEARDPYLRAAALGALEQIKTRLNEPA